MKKFLLALALALLVSSPAAAGSFEDGVLAMQKGDYQTARARWAPLAKEGHAGAQYNLGALYANGLGIKQDMHTALKWFDASAQQGNPHAMFSLGMLYADGNGTDQNLGAAYVWFRLALKYGAEDPTFKNQVPTAQNYLSQVMGAMTKTQMLQYENVVMQWRPKKSGDAQ